MIKIFILLMGLISLIGCDASKQTVDEKLYRPDFSLPDLQGIYHDNSEWDGKVVVINFWATWCPPCIKEIPSFIKLQDKYADRGLQFVGIAIDNLEEVQNFVTQMNINYPILVGEENAMIVSSTFGNRMGALPFTVIIDRERHVTLQYTGKMSLRKVESAILPLL